MVDGASLFDRTELGVQTAVVWPRLVIESMGALVIAVGIVVAIALLVRSAMARRGFDVNQVRLALARHLALALEFQLAADILSTAIAPSWDRIGKLAVIRTALNYFLMLELRSETGRSEDRRAAGAVVGA